MLRRVVRLLDPLRFPQGGPPTKDPRKLIKIPGSLGQNDAYSHMRIAFVAHCYYENLFHEIKDLAAVLPTLTDIFITTNTESKRTSLLRVFESFGRERVIVNVIPNKGRDLPSKLISFRNELFGYDLVLFVHTKLDTHQINGSDWRKYLFRNLVGSTDRVSSIVQLFAKNEKLGVVFPDYYPPILPWIRWGRNFPLGKLVALKFGYRLRRRDPIDFPAGSMFWARPQALAPLVNLKLSSSDMPDEPVASDGTILHALERLILHSCLKANLTWIKIEAQGSD